MHPVTMVMKTLVLSSQEPTQESNSLAIPSQFRDEPYETASVTQNTSFGVDTLGNLLEDASFTPTQLSPKKPRLCLGAQSGHSDEDSSYNPDSDSSSSSRESRSKSKLADLQHTTKCQKTIPSPPDDEVPLLSCPYVTTCIDAHNGFKEVNQKAMLWTVQHLWPSGSRFDFNCYWHYSMLILQQKNDSCYTLQSRESFTQGDPFSMVIYGCSLWFHSLNFSENKHLL